MKIVILGYPGTVILDPGISPFHGITAVVGKTGHPFSGKPVLIMPGPVFKIERKAAFRRLHGRKAGEDGKGGAALSRRYGDMQQRSPGFRIGFQGPGQVFPCPVRHVSIYVLRIQVQDFLSPATPVLRGLHRLPVPKAKQLRQLGNLRQFSGFLHFRTSANVPGHRYSSPVISSY